jgi:hypothetical protein
MAPVFWKLAQDPTWRPYCLACRTMDRMTRDHDVFRCRSCGMTVDLAMHPVDISRK